MRVIIIGGGIAGATAAVSLRRAGHDVVVHEQAPEPREVGAGIGLWGNAVAALRLIDLAEPVLARGERMRVAEVRAASGRLISRAEWAQYERYGSDFFALVHRAELLEELLRPLPGNIVRFGSRFVASEPDGAGVRARFENGDTEAGDLLIGADGLHSRVRAELLGPSAPRYVGYTCWRGVVEFPSPRIPPGYVAEIWGRGARFGITRIGLGRVYWWATLNAPPSPGEQGRLDQVAKATLLRTHGRFCDPVPAIIDATDAGHILRNDLYDRRPDPRWTGPRRLLIGDAAHPTTPNLGQGGCMAIEDGVVLARFLRDATTTDEADLASRLQAFARTRYRKTAAVVRQSHTFGITGQWEHPLLCWARDHIAPLTIKASFRSMVRRFGRIG